VVTAASEFELFRGELVIGRDPTAHILLEDPLVSRFHARIVVGADRQIIVEDLQSANGIFVNGVRLSRPARLVADGDRILLGTTEISVFGMRDSTTGESSPAVPPSSRSPASDLAEQLTGGSRRSTMTTGRADPSDLVGQFAQRLMASGRMLEAVQTLSDHLQSLLRGAKAGLNVPPRILESATHHALQLHQWTGRASWLDFIFEIHIASLQVPSQPSLDQLEPVLNKATGWDVELVGYFGKAMGRRPEPLTSDELMRLRKVEQLARAHLDKQR
jgi:pSer/pThr/pTyr-binding forkhead associated (FHA) protein